MLFILLFYRWGHGGSSRYSSTTNKTNNNSKNPPDIKYLAISVIVILLSCI